jgi:hypothetical protein
MAATREIAMRIAVIGFAAVAATFMLGVPPGEAQTRTTRPWCVQEGGTDDGGILDCSYLTFAQCEESARGMGSCVQNPRYLWERRDPPQRRQDGQRR